MDPALKEILARRTAAAGGSPAAAPAPRDAAADAARAARPQPGAPAHPHMKALVVPPLPEACRALANLAPASMQPEDRLRLIARQIVDLPEEERAVLVGHVQHLVRRMIDVGASDIDFGGTAARGMIWYRVDGDKRPDEAAGQLEMAETDVLALSLLSRRQIKLLLRERSVDFSFQLPVKASGQRQRFRATSYFDNDNVAVNMRAIADEVRPLRSLGFHPLVEKGLLFQHVRDGLTLVTGVTGSGKSSTLDAIIDANNQTTAGHVIIIGKPIEYMHASKRCIVRHREVGKDVPTFKDGIVQSLRQDPDIVVIGEMRDPETISAGLEITDSGHKVFSTLHTSSAVESIDRIIGEYPPEEQNRIRNRLADVLRCVVSQKLCPKVGGGRVLAKEVLWMTPSARAAIKNENTNEIYQMMWEGGAQGQITLEQDLARLAMKRLITPETALDYANNKRRLQQLLQ